MAARVILIDVAPRNAATGAAVALRLAGGGADAPYYYGGQHYRAGITAQPAFQCAINFDGGDFGTGGVPQAAELSWSPSSKADLAAAAGYFWVDAPITVRIGEESAVGTLPPVRLTGKVLSATVDGAALKLVLSDPAADLKKPLLSARYGGTGGLDGPAEWDGKIKRRVWGRIWNLAGICIDKANNIYSYADPSRPLQSIDAVRDKGAPAATLTMQAWAGSAAATFTALQAAAAPQGGGVVCPSIACVKWWTQPAGDLTADLRGEIGGAYVETTAEIVERIVQAGPATPFATGTVAAARVARPAPVGYVAEDEYTTAASVIDTLLGNSSLLWLLDANGQIVLREWAWGASIAVAISLSVSRKETFKPVVTRKVGYRKNQTKAARGDLAAIVLVNDVAFSDGGSLVSAIDDAATTATWAYVTGSGKPADNADVTGTHTAAAITGQAATATSSDFSVITGVTKPEANADVTSLITGAGTISINAAYTGAITDALPRTQPYALMRQGTDVTSSSSWSVAVMSGTMAASIGAGTGVLSINASGGTLTSGRVRITATYGMISRSSDVVITINTAAAPNTGISGGTAATGATNGSTSSTTMVPVGDTLTVIVGPSGNVALSAYYNFTTSAVSGSYAVKAQWYRWNGAAYVAIGSAITSSANYTPSAGDSGNGACNYSDTGLTAGSVQKYQLFMANSSGTVPRTISGDCAAVGS